MTWEGREGTGGKRHAAIAIIEIVGPLPRGGYHREILEPLGILRKVCKARFLLANFSNCKDIK